MLHTIRRTIFQVSCVHASIGGYNRWRPLQQHKCIGRNSVVFRAFVGIAGIVESVVFRAFVRIAGIVESVVFRFFVGVVVGLGELEVELKHLHVRCQFECGVGCTLITTINRTTLSVALDTVAQ